LPLLFLTAGKFDTQARRTTGRLAVNKERPQIAFSAESQPPHDWARLLRKLRWIGLEADAERLEVAVCAVPPEQRSGAAVASSDTD